MRCEHTQSHTQTEAGLRTKLFSLTKRGVKNTLFGTNMCFIPQKVTIKIAVENKRLWLGVMCKIVIVSSVQVNKSKSLVRCFLYHSRYE